MSQTFAGVPVLGSTTLQLPAYLDAAGVLRVSQPQNVFDSKFIADAQPFYWDDAQTSGSGTTSAFQTNQALVKMSVTAATAGTRVRQTFRRFGYQPGKGGLIKITRVLGAPAAGITKRSGYFDASNGFYVECAPTTLNFVVRTKTSGSVVNNATAQASWNVDTMLGGGGPTNPSGLTLDPTKDQLFWIDFLWQGVGSVRFGVQINGINYLCHQINSANVIALPYMGNPNLPLRDEIINDGTGGAASLLQICSTVIAEGGANFVGSSRGVGRDGTAFTAANNTNLWPVLAIRLAAGFEMATVKDFNFQAWSTTSGAACEWYALVNPTVTGTALSFAALTNSAVEVARGATNATSVSGGTGIACGGFDQGTVSDSPHISDYALGSSIAGVNDVLVLAMRKLLTNAPDLFGTIEWNEQI